ncbi:hypothetical protein CANCADRAFT_19741, partial [Tortispora caseinolytica NRRL Y-17796]
YWSYYIPFLAWLPHYTGRQFSGDLIAGITIASFQIPLSLSYATSLAKVGPNCGLYGFAVAPLIYFFLGTVPQLVVGPEPALSLLVGEVVKSFSDHKNSDASALDSSFSKVPLPLIVSVISAICGTLLLISGIFRLGYLDSVFSQSLLCGFISGVGITILVDQLLEELGLASLAAEFDAGHYSPIKKFLFVCNHLSETHRLTLIISVSAFTIIKVIRAFKFRFQDRHKWVVYVPDIFLVVVLFTTLSAKLDWDEQGVHTLGLFVSRTPSLYIPFRIGTYEIVKKVFTTALLITILGFCETTVAAKGMGSKYDLSVSTNRELVALGVANFGCSLFGALPSFGGYGRSKINALSGACTQVSGLVLSAVSIISIAFLVPLFQHIPLCVLSATISVVALSLLEEAPHDIWFYYTIGGYQDLALLFLTFLATVFWSLNVGVSLGVSYSLLRVLKHSTQPRIQILARRGGSSYYENADSLADDDDVQEIEGCLIVKIPEPLTFANAGQLKGRLHRLELYGSMRVHPSHPPTRSDSMNRNIIIDLKGMTECDASAVLTMYQIVESYRKRDVYVFFSRMPTVAQIREQWDASGITD